MGQLVDRRGHRSEGLGVFKRVVWRPTVVCYGVRDRRRFGIVGLVRGIETDRGMTTPPAMVIVAEVGKNGEEPGREPGVWR